MTHTAATERAKYTRVWTHAAYRRISPGHLLASRAYELLGMEGGHSLIDYGAGPARATSWFAKAGLDVLAVDIAANASEHPDVPYIEACLWEMDEDVPSADWSYAVDVLEHIPEDRVGEVLRAIAARTRKAAFFQIATRPDVMGPKLIGEPLHLTVRDANWWADAIQDAFGCFELVEKTDRDLICVGRIAA